MRVRTRHPSLRAYDTVSAAPQFFITLFVLMVLTYWEKRTFHWQHSRDRDRSIALLSYKLILDRINPTACDTPTRLDGGTTSMMLPTYLYMLLTGCGIWPCAIWFECTGSLIINTAQLWASVAFFTWWESSSIQWLQLEFRIPYLDITFLNESLCSRMVVRAINSYMYFTFLLHSTHKLHVPPHLVFFIHVFDIFAYAVYRRGR